MRTARITDTTVTLNLLDALELSELLDYLAQWLRTSGDTVPADLARYAGTEHAALQLPRLLTAFGMLLVLGEDGTDEDADVGCEHDLNLDAIMEQRW